MGLQQQNVIVVDLTSNGGANDDGDDDIIVNSKTGGTVITSSRKHLHHHVDHTAMSSSLPHNHNDLHFLNTFQHQQHQHHSLRINVSDLAACAGFHPYKCLPRLLQDHVYQGSVGRALLRHDLKLLGMTMVSDEDIWKELAKKAGTATQEALQQALHVQQGKRKVISIEAAEELRRKVVTEAKSSKKLSSTQIATLEEGTRQSIHTGFGTTWENHALDKYEKQCGWEVQLRNEEIRTWDFQKDGKEMGPVKRSSSNGSGSSDSTCGNSSRNVASHICKEDEYPFFSIRGSIDGIRDELGPPLPFENTSVLDKDRVPALEPNMEEHVNDEFNDGDNQWTLRKVVVECKHRMNRIQPSPPIYEMIQATAYCLMYGTQEADIVQVLRKKTKTDQNSQSQKRKQRHHHRLLKEKEFKNSNEKITNYFVSEDTTTTNPSNIIKNVPQDKGETKTTTTTTRTNDESESHLEMDTDMEMEIAINRISIDDPIFLHRQNWYNVIVPRLISWTKTVYKIRQDDDQRYRLLTLLAMHDNHASIWEDILFEQCPWLRDCDTSYQRHDVNTISGLGR